MVGTADTTMVGIIIMDTNHSALDARERGGDHSWDPTLMVG